MAKGKSVHKNFISPSHRFWMATVAWNNSEKTITKSHAVRTMFDNGSTRIDVTLNEASSTFELPAYLGIATVSIPPSGSGIVKICGYIDEVVIKAGVDITVAGTWLDGEDGASSQSEWGRFKEADETDSTNNKVIGLGPTSSTVRKIPAFQTLRRN